MKTGVQLIQEERQKQIEKHGFTGKHHYEHDEWYESLQLQSAAHSMLANELYKQAEVYDNVPQNWDAEWWENLCNRTRKERLVIAGALIAAELDRMAFIERKNECQCDAPIIRGVNPEYCSICEKDLK